MNIFELNVFPSTCVFLEPLNLQQCGKHVIQKEPTAYVCDLLATGKKLTSKNKIDTPISGT